MDKALIVTDYTYDFIADEGLLTCGKPGQAIEGKIASLVEEFGNAGQYIVVANDIHREDDGYHPEATLFPPHNLIKTAGRELYGKVRQAVNQFVLAGGEERIVHIMDKTRYSAFAGTDLELRLRERKINQVHLVGVCTDICILHTAIDAYNKGFEIVVHKDGVATFNPTGHEWALNHFVSVLGAKVL